MSIEVSIFPVTDSDNTNPSKISFWESGNDEITIELHKPDRLISITKKDWSKLCLVIPPIKGT